MEGAVEGQIRKIVGKKGTSWSVSIFLGRDAKGKRQFHYKTVKGTKAKAQAYCRKKLRELDTTGTLFEPTDLTLDKYLDKWLEAAAKPKLTPLTFQHYKDILDRYVRPVFGEMKLCRIQTLDVQKLYSEMQERGLSARIVRYTHAVLSSSFKMALKWQLLQQNPCANAELPRKERSEMQAMTPEQAAKFLTEAQSDRFGVLFNVAVIAGLRPSEYFGLQWKDIDFNSGVLTVQRTLAWLRDGTWYFGEPKTSRSRRSIPLPQEIIDLLREHKRVQAEERIKAAKTYENRDLVFANSQGNPLMLHNLTVRHFRPILKRAGLPQTFRIYDLRHTCASLLLAAGENPKVVAERLGHSSVTITLDTYSHVLPTMQRSASDKLANMLFSKAVS